MNVKLKQNADESTDYGSTTSVKFDNKFSLSVETNDAGNKSESQSSVIKWWQCDSNHLYMHCAAISGVLPEYGNTVGDSLIVPYLLELGAPVWCTSYVWVITPFIDSWMQPIYGKLSDKFTSKPNACCKCGGRKPFIILFGIFATIGLIVIPQARIIKKYGHITTAVIVCILSYTLMDMSHGDLLIPTRALLNDLCNNSTLMKYGNEKFTFYQAIGRCLGYFVVSLNWKYIIATSLPTFETFLIKLELYHHVSICFTLSIFILWFIILFVVLFTPNQIKRLHIKTHLKQDLSIKYQPYSKRTNTNKKTISNEMLITPSGRVVILHPSVLITYTISSILSSDTTYGLSRLNLYDIDNSDLSSSFQLTSFDDSENNTNEIEYERNIQINDILSPVVEDRIDTDQERDQESQIVIKTVHTITDTVDSMDKILSTPKTQSNIMDNEEEEIINQHHEHIRELWKFPFHFKLYWIIQFFGWCNFAAFSLYFTSFIAVDIYNGTPNGNFDSHAFAEFEMGIRTATAILLMSAGIAALSGKVLIPYMNDKIGVKLVFFSGELLLNILCILLLIRNDIVFVIIITCLYGIAIQIHYNNVFIIIEHDLRDLFKSEHKRAYVLSIFNLSILFANVLVSVFAGWIVQLFRNVFVWGIAFFAIVAFMGDSIVYILFFITQRHHMLDQKYHRKIHIPNNIIIDQ
eukprot:265943_1